jgi:hypothetical protein
MLLLDKMELLELQELLVHLEQLEVEEAMVVEERTEIQEVVVTEEVILEVAVWALFICVDQQHPEQQD